jgi:hypothetical protein
LPYSQQNEVRRTGHILLRSCLLKYIIEGNIYGKGDEEDVSSFWIILRARNALPRGLVMLKVMDQTQGM